MIKDRDDNDQVALNCPACKIIIDYSALQAAGAALDKHAYGAWVAVRHGYESGAFAWDDVKDEVYEVCEMAEKVTAFIAKSEKFIRALAERPV